MDDQELKAILKPLIECLSDVTEKQGRILELLSRNLPGIAYEEKIKLQSSSQENLKNAEKLRHSLQSWK